MNGMELSKKFIGNVWFIIHVHLFASLLVPNHEAASFDEVNSLHVWITISSVARKDPNNSDGLLFRQIELNWINAPLDNSNDYIGLYLDGEPENNELPVSVHKLNGRLNGQITTDYYLPQLDYFNETKYLSFNQDPTQQSNQASGMQPDPQNDITLSDHPDGIQMAPEVGSRASLDGHRGGRDSSDIRWRRYGSPRRAIASSPTLSHGSWSSFVGHDSAAISPSDPFVARTNARVSLIKDQCVGYCLAYHSRDKILAKNCLKTNPTWMESSFQQIGARALPSLMIPGSHNSGTYPKQMDKTVLQMINKYQLNQDDNIFNQLMFGIRHLDLRVGYSKVKHHPERLWIYHDIFRTDISLNEVVEQVKRFLDLTSHEIIIMDFHRFTVGFQNENPSIQRERHAKVIELLFDKLGHYIVPSYLGQHAPLQEYIAMGKRLLIGYADRQQLVGHLGDNGAGHTQLFALYREQKIASTNKKSLRSDNRQLAGARGTVGSIPEAELIGGSDTNNNIDASNNNMTESGNKQALEPEAQFDRRMGTRIYNRLKSLKLISNSFSRRTSPSSSSSSPGEQVLRVSNDKLLDNIEPTDDRHSMKISTTSNYEDQNGAQISSRDLIAAQINKVALFFQPVRHLWPNKDTIEGLAQYLNETACRKYFGELRSLMVELTPTVFGAISDKYDGNRKLAQRVNRPVTDWIRDRWLHCANIVASDYFLGNDLIRLAINANKMRLQHRSNTPDMNSYGGECKSFKRIEHMLDKSKIPIQFTYQAYPHDGDNDSKDNTGHRVESFGASIARNNKFFIDNNLITHTSSDGNKILLRPMTSSHHNQISPSSASSSSSSLDSSAQARERRDSFVDNVSEGFADILSSFKRLFNFR